MKNSSIAVLALVVSFVVTSEASRSQVPPRASAHATGAPNQSADSDFQTDPASGKDFRARAEHPIRGQGSHSASADRQGGQAHGGNSAGAASASSVPNGAPATPAPEQCGVLANGDSRYQSRTGTTSASVPSNKSLDSFAQASSNVNGGSLSVARTREGQAGGSATARPSGAGGIPGNTSTTARPAQGGPQTPVNLRCCFKIFVVPPITGATPIPPGFSVSGSTRRSGGARSRTATQPQTAGQFFQTWSTQFPQDPEFSVAFDNTGITVCGTCPLLVSMIGWSSVFDIEAITPDTAAEGN